MTGLTVTWGHRTQIKIDRWQQDFCTVKKKTVSQSDFCLWQLLVGHTPVILSNLLPHHGVHHFCSFPLGCCFTLLRVWHLATIPFYKVPTSPLRCYWLGATHQLSKGCSPQTSWHQQNKWKKDAGRQTAESLQRNTPHALVSWVMSDHWEGLLLHESLVF